MDKAPQIVGLFCADMCAGMWADMWADRYAK
jgi:hypothetical protein